MKTKTSLLTLLILLLLFSGCFSAWQEDTGTIILNLGGNSRNVENFPPTGEELNELEYEIIFSGANDEFTRTAVGSKSVNAIVMPGEWKITVKAYIDKAMDSLGGDKKERIMYAIGKETVKVRPGQSTPVKVKMSNMGEVEIIFIRVDKDFQVEKYKFSINFSKSDYDYEDSRDFIGKGPHLVPLERGNWEIKVNSHVEDIENIDNPGDYDGAIINSEVYFDESWQKYMYVNYNYDNPYETLINPGDRKTLLIEISNDWEVKP